MNAPIRNAFVLGAGLGTRLRALTAHKAKPLIPICGKPLITFAFDHLIRNGVQNIVVNTHHRPEGYAEMFPDHRYGDAGLTFEHEPQILETAGGMKNAEAALRNGTFIVYNGDILSDLPIERAITHHFEQRNEVTLILRSSGGPLHVALNPATGQVVDIANRLRPASAPDALFSGSYLFTGIYIVNPQFLFKIPSRTKISVIPIFLHMIKREQKIGGIVIDQGSWWDLGTREKYLEVHRYFQESPHSFRQTHTDLGWPMWIHPRAKISPSAKISGATVIGADAVVGEGAELHDTILWENTSVEAGSVLRNCIVTAGQSASGTHLDLDF